MSDVEVTPGKPLPWTDEAKSQFLLRIIAQLRDDGRCINWSRVSMEGRTTKSLQNMWTKINKEISEIEAAENGENGVITPSKPRTATPRKTRAKKIVKSEAAVAADGSGDDNEPDMKKTPKKRALSSRAAGNSAVKKPKAADTDDDEAVKEEYSGYEAATEM